MVDLAGSIRAVAGERPRSPSAVRPRASIVTRWPTKISRHRRWSPSPGPGYTDEAGEAKLVDKRLTPADRDLLKKLPTPEGTLADAHSARVKAGLRPCRGGSTIGRVGKSSLRMVRTMRKARRSSAEGHATI